MGGFPAGGGGPDLLPRSLGQRRSGASHPPAPGGSLPLALRPCCAVWLACQLHSLFSTISLPKPPISRLPGLRPTWTAVDEACPQVRLSSSPAWSVEANACWDGGTAGRLPWLQASHVAHEPLLRERPGVSRRWFPRRRLPRAGTERMLSGPPSWPRRPSKCLPVLLIHSSQ